MPDNDTPAPCLKPHKMRCLAFAPVLKGTAEPCAACAPYLAQTRATLGPLESYTSPASLPFAAPVLIRVKP